jgi:hypothetical protein
MDLNEPVSGRQFAKMVGQAESAVRKAKNRGSIIKGVTANGKYIPLIASNEWGKAIMQEFLTPVNVEELFNQAVIKLKKQAAIEKKLPAVKTPIVKKTKKEPETIEDFVNEIMHEKLPSADADDLDDETVSEELDDRIQKPEAERVTAVLKAKILQITYKEKQGQLVPIDKVNTVLFGYGQEIRNALESIPDRVIDRILAVADKRHEARRILANEIQDTLELLADIETREFS